MAVDADDRANSSAESRYEKAGAVQPDGVQVWEDEFHRLHISFDGEEHEGVRPVRVFPVSGKADYVSFLGDDGKEVLLLAHPDKLHEESRRTLCNALEKMYYVAKITRVDAISERMGVTHWRVMTDRGYAEFEVVHRENIRRLPGGRFLITDADGNRFEIEDVSALDIRSRKLIFSET